MTNMRHLGLALIVLLFAGASVAQTQEQLTDMYQEPFRPQFHYSPPCGWTNDPNGMVYYEGEYHLFYQYNPDDIVWGPMHWGHAVSPDLVHWETLPIALYPDDIGPIWSGSAVVDANNTSGLVPGGGLVAIFSYQDQSQGIAYSSDKGRTWTKYAGNPVIPALAKDFRDPKVIWHEASQHWVMVIAAGREIQIFTSPNLLNWEMSSSLTGGLAGGIWEVPDLFPLELEGQTKWVLLGSETSMAPAGGGGVRYLIGDFDGTTFTYDKTQPALWLDYGPDNYAGTTWSDSPDGKRIYIGWMDNWLYAGNTPTERWRGAMTLPREFHLVQTEDGIRLAQQPVAAITELREPIGVWDDLKVDGQVELDGVKGRTLEIIADIELSTAERFGIALHAGGENATRLVYNTPQSKLFVSRSDKTATGFIANFTPAFGAPIPPDNNQLHLRIFVDESSVEVFTPDGLVSLTSRTFVNPADDGLALFADKGDVKFSHLEIYSLASTWDKNSEAAATCSFIKSE
ncbi:MAG: glycoside hydrolase family 32 protein [Anaerolineae bacterium]